MVRFIQPQMFKEIERWSGGAGEGRPRAVMTKSYALIAPICLLRKNDTFVFSSPESVKSVFFFQRSKSMLGYFLNLT